MSTNTNYTPSYKGHNHSYKGKRKNNLEKRYPKEKVPSLLYIKQTGKTTKQQLRNIFQNAIDRSSKQCLMKITMPVNEQGKYKGFAFIWFSSPDVPNMLTGNNRDGSQMTSNLFHICSSKYNDELELRLSDIKKYGDPHEKADVDREWWYICYREEQRIKDEYRKRLGIKSVTPPPLLKLQYDERKIGKISFEHCTIRRYKEGLSSNILYGKLDKLITEDDLRNEMEPFITTMDNSYPIIKIIPRDKYNEVYLEFSSNGVDAQTARKIVYDYTFINKRGRQCHLHLEHPSNKHSKLRYSK